jgi:hypothetical protein
MQLLFSSLHSPMTPPAVLATLVPSETEHAESFGQSRR